MPKQYEIKANDGHVCLIEANNEADAMEIATIRMGFLAINPLKNYAVYSNIDGECECCLCECNDNCVHSGAYRRLPKSKGGLGLCKKINRRKKQ